METIPSFLPTDHNRSNCTRNLRAVQDALYALGGKWKLPIIVVLAERGAVRFSDLQREVVGITPKLLSKELKELELNGFVSRRVTPTTPVLIQYALTDYSSSLQSIITALRDWGLQHRQHVQAQ